jgi:hypothetical protein
VCGVSQAIVYCDKAGEQDCHISEPYGDSTRGKSMRLCGAMSTSCRLLCWTQPDDLVLSSAMDIYSVVYWYSIQ